MKRFICQSAVLVALFFVIASTNFCRADEVSSPLEDGKAEKVGVYDSRSIAISFAGSEKFQEILKPLIAEFNEAKAAGDTKKMEQLKAHGRGGQAKMHRQGFGTESVEDILALYPDEVQKIKQSHQLSALVSKWDSATLKKYPKAKQIDLTKELIEITKPSERQRRAAIDIQRHEPLANWQIETHELSEENPMALVWIVLGGTLLITALVVFWARRRWGRSK
jgi:hypothetical protein